MKQIIDDVGYSGYSKMKNLAQDRNGGELHPTNLRTADYNNRLIVLVLLFGETALIFFGDSISYAKKIMCLCLRYAHDSEILTDVDRTVSEPDSTSM